MDSDLDDVFFPTLSGLAIPPSPFALSLEEGGIDSLRHVQALSVDGPATFDIKAKGILSRTSEVFQATSEIFS